MLLSFIHDPQEWLKEHTRSISESDKMRVYWPRVCGIRELYPKSLSTIFSFSLIPLLFHRSQTLELKNHTS